MPPPKGRIKFPLNLLSSAFLVQWKKTIMMMKPMLKALFQVIADISNYIISLSRYYSCHASLHSTNVQPLWLLSLPVPSKYRSVPFTLSLALLVSFRSKLYYSTLLALHYTIQYKALHYTLHHKALQMCCMIYRVSLSNFFRTVYEGEEGSPAYQL